ncbi:sensor histidine kinase [Geodermatophilus sp. SYSU D00700]
MGRATRADPATAARASAAVLGLTVLLPVVEVWRIALAAPSGTTWKAITLGVLILPLHVRHVRAGLAGRRSASHLWTLALLAVLVLSGLMLVGSAWVLMLAQLALSCLILLPRAWGLVMLAATVVVAVLAVSEGEAFRDRTAFVAAAIIFRSGSVFSIVWYVSVLRRQAAARAAVVPVAVAEARAVTGRAVLDVAAPALTRMRQYASAAATQLAAGDEEAARSDLGRLVELSRTTLRRLREAIRQLHSTAATSEWTRAAELLQTPSTGAQPRPVPPPSPPATGQVSAPPVPVPVGRGSTLVVMALGQLPVHVYALLASAGALTGTAVAWGSLGLGVAIVVLHATLNGLVLARDGAVISAVAVGVAVLAWIAVPVIGVAGVAASWYGIAALLAVPGWRVVAGLNAAALLVAHTVVSYQASGVPTPAAEWVWAALYLGAVTVAGVLCLWLPPHFMWLLDDIERTRQLLSAQARTQEELRLTRELHDLYGHGLSALSLTGDLALRLLARDPALAAVQGPRLAAIADRLTEESDLVLRGGVSLSVAAELERAARLLMSAGMDVTTNVVGLPAGSTAEAESLLCWAVREGVTNILRHSAARTVELRLLIEDDAIILQVGNDGATGDTRHGGGLSGLAARAHALGGTCTIVRASDVFTLIVRVPSGAVA